MIGKKDYQGELGKLVDKGSAYAEPTMKLDSLFAKHSASATGAAILSGFNQALERDPDRRQGIATRRGQKQRGQEISSKAAHQREKVLGLYDELMANPETGKLVGRKQAARTISEKMKLPSSTVYKIILNHSD